MIYLLAVFVLLFGIAVFVGAPYLPTFKKQTLAALDLLELKPGQTLIDLGSGDGRLLKHAAERGVNCIGYEINPLLVLTAHINTWKYRKKVKIIWGNYWRKEWPKADGVYVFLIDKYMDKLDKKLEQYPHKPINLASFTFKVPGKKPLKASNGVYLYKYR